VIGVIELIIVEGDTSVRYEPDVKPASRLDLSWAYTIDLARSFSRRILKNTRRTPEVVDSEYNAGEWGRILRERAWLRALSLEEFLVGDNASERLAKVDDRIVRITTPDYYRYRIAALSELISRHAGGTTALLELGAGFGYNLFSLSLDPQWSRLRGLDIAPNGIEAGRQIANHFDLADRVSFGRIDLTESGDAGFAELAGSTVFTYFCIEQIPYAVEAVVENIIRAKPARVINVEPDVDMLNLSEPRDLASWLYVASMGYQTRLSKLLDNLDRSGRIRVLARERMRFAPTFHYDGLLYAWEPR
jgi:hypothetical protein